MDDWLKRSNQYIYICCFVEIPFRAEDRKRLKVRDGKRHFMQMEIKRKKKKSKSKYAYQTK